MRRNTLVVIGIVLIVLAAAWRAWLSPPWTQRIPQGWKWEARFVGVLTEPDPRTRRFPEKDSPASYTRVVEAVSHQGAATLIRDLYRVTDALTKQVAYEYVYQATVDARTGKYAAGPHRGEYLTFPQGVRRGTYLMRHSYLKGIPVAFEAEDVLHGLRTYRFGYQGRGEYTESYAGTSEFAGVQVEPGQEIRCMDDRFVYRAWVEPTTGSVVKVDESCHSGDYVYEVATGKALYPVTRWGGVIAGDEVSRLVDLARQERTRLLAAEVYVPALLLAAGIVSAGAGLLRRPRGSL